MIHQCHKKTDWLVTYSKALHRTPTMTPRHQSLDRVRSTSVTKQCRGVFFEA